MSHSTIRLTMHFLHVMQKHTYGQGEGEGQVRVRVMHVLHAMQKHTGSAHSTPLNM